MYQNHAFKHDSNYLKYHTRGQLAKECNLPTSILSGRLVINWSLDDVLKTPIKNRKGS